MMCMGRWQEAAFELSGMRGEEVFHLTCLHVHQRPVPAVDVYALHSFFISERLLWAVMLTALPCLGTSENGWGHSNTAPAVVGHANSLLSDSSRLAPLMLLLLPAATISWCAAHALHIFSGRLFSGPQAPGVLLCHSLTLFVLLFSIC